MTPQKTQKICFRFTGDADSIAALTLINRRVAYRYDPINGCFYTSDLRFMINMECNYTLVTPAEFIRLMKGESQWTPKYGEEVGIESCLSTQPQTGILKTSFKSDNGDTMYVVQVGEDSWRITPTIRPIRKSLREELTDVLQQLRKDQISEHVQTVSPYTDCIIQLLKERGVEG